MDYDPPSAMTRFGIFFLVGGVALIFVLWGVLKYIDRSPKTIPVTPQPPPQAHASDPPPGRAGH